MTDQRSSECICLEKRIKLLMSSRLSRLIWSVLVMLKLSPSERNNDGEYIDQKFQNYLAAENINWDSRASYVSEQNGEVERLNRTLMYKIRSMLNQTKISRSMWEEIIKTIAYLSNRSSHYQLNDKISYEMIRSKKSNLSHLQIIESTTWVHISKEKTKSLTIVLEKKLLWVMRTTINIVSMTLVLTKFI